MGSHNERFRTRPQVEALETRWQPAALDPTYTVTFADAITTDNEFMGADGKQYWTVDSGADSYQTDMYERPTSQTYEVVQAADGTWQFAASEYFSNLDIVEGRAGFDDTYLYVSIKLAGLTKETSDGKSTDEGLVYRYGFRLALEADGGGGLLVVADQPELKNGTQFGREGTFIYRDTNGDVGGTGLSVTKQDRQAEVDGNGYERVLASDGRLSNGQQVLWVRVSPTDPTVVEFALKYQAVGLTATDLQNLPYLEFEANKGLQDPGNYAWNDEYTKSEAGSPYRATTGDLSKSEFDTQGLGNIYELDTLRGGAIVVEGEGSISGFVWVDSNGDGARDADEPRLGGVVIHLSGVTAQGEMVEMTTTTDANGFYIFEGLQPGTYNLTQEQPASYTDPNGNELPLADGQDYLGFIPGADAVNFGAAANDQFFNILLGPDQEGQEYNFTEMFQE
ncbi:MAG: hypothetical protein L0241_27775 [Planctomycetia bacterium]|nr:hypothetical protein [Planctomycetia bacterium]